MNGTTAGFTDASGNLIGNVDVSGNSLLEFTQNGTITGIAQDASLSLDGPSALVADGNAPTTNSALSGLASNAGSLSLADGAVVTTSGPLTNTGSISIGDAPGNQPQSTATSILDINGPATSFGSTASALDGSVSLQGNAQLEFTTGSLSSIASDGTLSIDGTSAFVADSNAPTSNSALSMLMSNAGNLSLNDGASITTTGPLANTGSIDLGTDNAFGSNAQTTLDIGGSAMAFGDTNGNLVGRVDLVGNSLLEFTGGSLAGISQGASLSIDGTSAIVADATTNDTAPTSNGALSMLTSNAGFLSLNDGASVTTTGALANTGTIDLGVDNTTASTATTTLDIGGSATAFGDAHGNLVGDVALAGNSLLEFTTGSLAGIDQYASLSIDGPNALVADATPLGTTPTSNSALTGLASNAGSLSLEDGAVVTTSSAVSNTGSISLSTPSEIGTGPQTILDVGSVAGFGTQGELTGNVSLSGNSLLEFAVGGSITSIGDANNTDASLSIDGTNAFVADAGATTPTSNNALSSLASNFGEFSLSTGASVMTSGSLANTGSIFIASGSLGLGSMGTLTNNSDGSLTVGQPYASEPTPATLSAMALDLTGGSTTHFASNAVIDVSSLTLSGNAFLDVNAPASAITSPTGTETPIGFAPGATAYLQLDAGAIPSTGGSFADPIDGFSQGDTLDLTSLGFVAGGSTTATLSGNTLTVTNGTVTDTLTLTNPGANSGFETTSDFNDGTVVQMVCFAQGTHIATMRGDVAVGDLVVGDLALTGSGAARPIRWLGHRTIDCRRHLAPADAWPVRVAAHAFGEGRPARDLFLSPGHPVLVGADGDGAGGHLVPIMCLLNGTTIERVPVDEVTYWHVELDAHDILLAEGLPAESYLDWGDRGFFTEGADHALANPDFVVPGLVGRCRPVAIDGPVVESERRRLDWVFAKRLAVACAWPERLSTESFAAGGLC